MGEIKRRMIVSSSYGSIPGRAGKSPEEIFTGKKKKPRQICLNL
jgi:hypothetical protein